MNEPWRPLVWSLVVWARLSTRRRAAPEARGTRIDFVETA